MNYKSYGTVKTAKSRRMRKAMRREVFTFNKKAAKTARKAARLERKSRMVEE